MKPQRPAVAQPDQRYWRGPVLHEFDGATWREAGRMPMARTAVDARGEAVRLQFGTTYRF